VLIRKPKGKMKNFYPHGHVMPSGDGSGERSPTQQVAISRTAAEDLSTAPRTYSLVKFNSYRKRGKAGSPPATSNLYDVLKKVDWLAIFSPWAIINRSKMYATSTKQSTCADHTSANNVALQNFEKRQTDAQSVVSKFFSDEFFGSFFAEKKERPVVASDGKPVRRQRGKTKSTTICKPFSSILHLLLPTIFVSVFICFSGAAMAQSRQDVGTAEAVEPFITRSNIQDFVEIKDIAHKKELILQYSPTADLEKYPLYEYKARTEAFDPLITGAIVPEYIWELPLRVVNDPLGRDSITLRQLAGEKILVLDFWATWCTPCMQSMAKWESILPKYADSLQVVGLMLDYDFKAELTVSYEGWTSPQIVGPEVYFLNYFFMGVPIVGPSAWIRNGRHWGITPTRNDNEALLMRILNERIETMPIENIWKGLAI